jgi:hypothetical protein
MGNMVLNRDDHGESYQKSSTAAAEENGKEDAGPQWAARVAMMMTGIRIAKNDKVNGEINHDGRRKESGRNA